MHTAIAHGDGIHPVGLVQHKSGVTLAQTEVVNKRNEVAASQYYLA